MTHTILRRRLAASASALLLAAVGLVTISTAASADPPEPEGDGPIVCTGSVTTDYDPPLGPLPKPTTQTVTELLGAAGDGSCTGPFAGGSAVTVFQQDVSCLLQGLGDTLVENEVTYLWLGGATSTITYPVTTVVRAAGQLVVTSTGTVTDGFRDGAVSERIAVYPDLGLLDCLSSSVDQQTGIITVTVT
jgi:hypothetical protein